MEPNTPLPGGSAPPDVPAPAPSAPDTVALLRRYAAGDTLTPKEFGQLGAHYANLGKPLPKEERAANLAKRSPGKTVAAGALVAPPPTPPGTDMAPGDSAPPADPALLADSCRVLLGTLEARLSKKVHRTAAKLGAPAPEAQRLADAAKFNPESKELVANGVALVCRKHAVSGEYAPEVTLLIGITDIGCHFADVLGELEELERRAEEREGRTKAPAGEAK